MTSLLTYLSPYYYFLVRCESPTLAADRLIKQNYPSSANINFIVSRPSFHYTVISQPEQ